MISVCSVCGSTMIQLDTYSNSYRCLFCGYDSLHSRETHELKKEEVYNKHIDIVIISRNDGHRYIYLNGKALKKYRKDELSQMRSDYTELLSYKTQYVDGQIEYQDFISFLNQKFNDFGIVYFNKEQAELANSIETRKNLVKQLSKNAIRKDTLLTICVDMVQSSDILNESNDNLFDIYQLLLYQNKLYTEKIIDSIYSKLTGDGFLAFYSKDKLETFLSLLKNIHEIESELTRYIIENNLAVSNKNIQLGVGIDISEILLMYGIGDLQVGLAVNRTTKLCKVHKRRYINGIALTTLRFIKYVQEWVDLSSKKDEKYLEADVYYIDLSDIETITQRRMKNEANE